jgi:hypothetical protein
MLQSEQHQIMAVVLVWVAGVVLQEAQVEAWVWEVITDLDVLSFGFIIKQIVATQPELVIAGMDKDGENGERGLARALGAGSTGDGPQERQTVNEEE